MTTGKRAAVALGVTITVLLAVHPDPAWARRGRRCRQPATVCCRCVCCRPAPPAPTAAPTQPQAPAPAAPPAPAPAPAAAAAPQGDPLFDGKTLQGWKVTNFGGEGEVKVNDGAIEMAFGYSLSGITYDGDRPLPKSNYEISLEARKLDGIDFFCGLTFPVKDSFCSLIVGGWAGSVVGLSSIDGLDASENDTTTYMDFKKGQWYRIKVRVTDDFITAWIDDKQVVKQALEGRQISIRPEVDLSTPLGISAFETKAALRNIRLRKLPDQAGEDTPTRAGEGENEPAENPETQGKESE